MALINLKTNLRSLKFGIGQASDKPGGGYSNQPYIVKSIPDYGDDASNVFNTGGPDSLLRGGLMAPIKSINDVSRLTQMFFDLKSPNGLLFIAKQNILSRTSVKTEASVGLGTAGGAVNQGVYLPTSTIAQAGVGFLGAHSNLLGLNPFSPGNGDPSYSTQLSSGGLVRYEDAAKNANKVDNNTFVTTLKSIIKTPNPLFFLNEPLLLGSESPQEPEFIETLIPSTTSGKFKNRLLNVWYNKQQQKSEDTIVLKYGGGPGSILGIGKTKIPFASQRTGINNPLAVSNPSYFYSGGGRKEEIERNLNNKLNGVTKVSKEYSAISEENKDKLQSFANPNRIVEIPKILDRSNTEITGATSYSSNIPLNSTPNTYLNLISSGSKQIDSNNSSNIELLSNTENSVLSKFTTNNKLFKDVVPTYQQKTWASTKNTAPSITYIQQVVDSNTSGSATNVYNSFIKPIPLNKNSKLDVEGYQFANGFNVYDSMIKGNTWPTNTSLQSSNNSKTWTQSQIIGEAENDGKKSGKPKIQDFRAKLIGTTGNFTLFSSITDSVMSSSPPVSSSTIMSLAPGYNTTKNIEERVGLGDPGKAKDVLKYSINEAALDKINASGFTSDKTPDHISRNDLVKFSIGILRNDGNGISDYINFRAFINEFSDKYNADWGEVQYIGRGDKFYNYKGFNRSVSMGWTVYAQSKAELIPMYKKLNFLASSLAPDYSSGSGPGYMRGNLARLTVGGYLYNTLGIIKSISYTVPQESTWEIGIDEEGKSDNSVKELPHMISVTGFDFTPIENTIPQKGKTRFITLTNGGNTNWSSGMQMP